MTKVVKLKKDSTNNKDSEIKQLNSKLNRLERKLIFFMKDLMVIL
ncbi:MAG: hypothetical protein CM15mP70_09600 [Pelagibacteraceae bacterium]|nr:MAG: hypothetical protein CM15mP70_09600 [Pelagibacteraceae bacterium]